MGEILERGHSNASYWALLSMILFMMLYKVVLITEIFAFVDEAIEQYFPVEMFNTVYKVVLTFKSVRKSLSGHSIDGFQAVFLCCLFDRIPFLVNFSHFWLTKAAWQFELLQTCKRPIGKCACSSVVIHSLNESWTCSASATVSNNSSMNSRPRWQFWRRAHPPWN